MSATVTPIRNLVLMLDTIRVREEAVDARAKENNWTDGEWAQASRVWCRQRQDIQCAIAVEPPRNEEDVRAILQAVSNIHDLIVAAEDEATDRDRRDLDEMIAVALPACIALMGSLSPSCDWTEEQHQAHEGNDGLITRWLPNGREPLAEAQA
jgi:hypothetical protein